MSGDEVSRDRAVKLFNFLSELAQLSAKTTRTWQEFEKVMWLHEIPQAQEVRRMAWRDGEQQDKSEIWLEIKKPPELKQPPKVPLSLTQWTKNIDVRNSDLEEPSIIKSVDLPQPGKVIVAGGQSLNFPQEADEQLETSQIWTNYLTDKWKPWAAEDRRLRAVSRVYTELFSLYQKQRQLGEEYELVIGFALLGCRARDQPEVHRHIFVARTHLAFDAVKGIISVGPAGEGAKVTLEQDMLDVEHRPRLSEPAFTRMVEEIGDAIWDQSRVSPPLQAWINSLSANGIYRDDLRPQKDLSATPSLHLAPALILRKRGDRNIVSVLKQIANQLHSTPDLPRGILKLVGGESQADKQESGEGGGIEEIYFPKPSNLEQRQIVDKLASKGALVVQGPPGTGKSHTIANLVCHLLSLGKKVLVTSHSPRALRVLQNKFPTGIGALCVALLDDDRKALKDLEASVDQITRKYESWQSEDNIKKIAQLQEQLQGARSRENDILTRLRSIREQEVYRHPRKFGSYQGTTLEIAQQLRNEEDAFSWIPVMPQENAEPPLSNQEALTLLSLMRLREERAGDLKRTVLDPDGLMNPKDFGDLIERESHTAEELNTYLSCRQSSWYKFLLEGDRGLLQQLGESLLELRKEMRKCLQHKDRWVQMAANDVLSLQSRRWSELHRVTQKHLQKIDTSVQKSSGVNVSGVRGRNRAEIRADAEVLLEHLEGGGKLGFWIFRPAVVRSRLYLIREVIVNGRKCDSPEPLKALIDWMGVIDTLDALRRRWAGLHVVGPTSFDGQSSEFRALRDTLQGVLDLRQRMENVKSCLAQFPGLLEPLWHSHDELQLLARSIDSVRVEDRLTFISAEIQRGMNDLMDLASKPEVHTVINDLRHAVESRNVEDYSSAFLNLKLVWGLREEMKRCEDLFRRLEKTAPVMAHQVQSSLFDSVWDDHLKAFEEAWNWARSDSWLHAITRPDEEQRLNKDLSECHNETEKFMEQLVEAKAWGHCFDHLTESEIQHLVAWRAAMNRVGRGTGKHAEKHRKRARQHMGECRSAIPAWIMPIFRVVETISPQSEVFDVVIVDEASQSGPEALFLYYLGKKVLIVGDDKQISPEPFTDLEVVEKLRQQYISDLTHCEAFGADYSFFDISKIFYPRFVRLKEHFRCMPEIIQFSNNLCYADQPLVPLRQYGQDRLVPVEVRYISSGFQQGTGSKVTNPPEAEALVEKITRCVKDPLYAGKTMGVISLLARNQAQYIEDRLRETIGPEEMARRQLICGDSYAFQGDERHVIFLSLVRAPSDNEAVMALTQARDERRFNVAASRARDQIWLFHTVTLNDLKTTCLRYRLIEYFENPHTEPPIGFDLDELRKAASNPNRDNHGQPAPFDSWFELDVFLRIAARGFRVLPQFEVAGYYIDLVVEGLDGRLAVECDGDRFHGPEKFAEDVARQRDLERCGWTFWRVRGSTFYRNPEAALESLWQNLEKLAIRPSTFKVDTTESCLEK
jgi:very-short-patch-repair endonuclease